jgi:hypothetical protein
MVGLLGITMQEMQIECNQNGDCNPNMNLQAATKFDCDIDGKNSQSLNECRNGHQRQNGGLNAPIERDNDDQTTTFSKNRFALGENFLVIVITALKRRRLVVDSPSFVCGLVAKSPMICTLPQRV